MVGVGGGVCVCIHTHAQVRALSWVHVYVCVTDFKSFIYTTAHRQVSAQRFNI